MQTVKQWSSYWSKLHFKYILKYCGLVHEYTKFAHIDNQMYEIAASAPSLKALLPIKESDDSIFCQDNYAWINTVVRW